MERDWKVGDTVHIRGHEDSQAKVVKVTPSRVIIKYEGMEPPNMGDWPVIKARKYFRLSPVDEDLL